MVTRRVAGRVLAFGLVTILSLVGFFALAEEDSCEKEKAHNNEKLSLSDYTGIPAAYRDGCGGCHMPYPPQLLPAKSWERILNGLADHFGTPVDLTAPQSNDIKSFLISDAATGKMAKEDTLRITETEWFRHEHRKKLGREPAGSMTDCQACHPGAIKGDFDDD